MTLLDFQKQFVQIVPIKKELLNELNLALVSHIYAQVQIIFKIYSTIVKSHRSPIYNPHCDVPKIKCLQNDSNFVLTKMAKITC